MKFILLNSGSKYSVHVYAIVESMKNIIIIAPHSNEKCGLIMEIIETIKKNNQTVSVSVLASLENYYIYYNNPSIDGILMTPKSIFSKLFSLPKNHYYIALDFQNSFIWNLSLHIADVKKHIKLFKTNNINEKQIQKVLELLQN